MSCILRHRSVQLILAYSWARPAILVAGKGRGGGVLYLLFLLFFHFHSCPFLSSLLLSLLSLFSLSLGDNTKRSPTQSISSYFGAREAVLCGCGLSRVTEFIFYYTCIMNYTLI